MNTIPLGAINKKTGKYVYPKIANKKDEYICPECSKDLIICKGNVRVHHFRHKVDSINPCHHYNSPSESQIHKDAKLLIKTLLEKKINVSFIRNCHCCKKNEEFEIPEITETSSIELEYRFEHNGLKIADVAYIDNGEIICIFEICHTHKTESENRPEPWFELNALKLIQTANDTNDDFIKIQCIRCEECEECIQKRKDNIEKLLQKEKDNIENKEKALNILYNWLKSGDEIKPFRYDYAKFSMVEKTVKSEYTNEVFDLILYVDPDDKDKEGRCGWERYNIKLMYNNFFENPYFVEERKYANFQVGVYYLDINWILLQTEIPKNIKYIASLDCYDNKKQDDTCNKCKTEMPFWVKRIDLTKNYKVIHIGCLNCGHNSNKECVNCKLCNSLDTPLWVMETNKINTRFCKNCDMQVYFSDKIYLSVQFHEKDEVKKLGAKWDDKCKKWYIPNNNTNINIFSKWN